MSSVHTKNFSDDLAYWEMYCIYVHVQHKASGTMEATHSESGHSSQSRAMIRQQVGHQ